MKRLILGVTLLVVALTMAFPDAAREYSQQFLAPEKEAIRTDVRLYRHQTGEIINLSLEDYITGVVAAEMPANFHPEALKAQAVCARTYILKRLAAGGVVNTEYPGADVSDNPRQGQGWVSREELRERWGTWGFYRHYYKIKRAVDSTDGLVLTFESQLIDPLYHSSCGGATENSEDVWKFRVPYLRSVICPYCEDPYPADRSTFALEELDLVLGTSLAVVAATAGALELPEVEIADYTSTGRPKLMTFGGQELAATLVRDRLGLRSTNFSYVVEDDRITFQTSGHGHGVGLCQYGARGLANAGFGFQDILQHYYSGIKVEPFQRKKG